MKNVTFEKSENPWVEIPAIIMVLIIHLAGFLAPFAIVGYFITHP